MSDEAFRAALRLPLSDLAGLIHALDGRSRDGGPLGGFWRAALCDVSAARDELARLGREVDDAAMPAAEEWPE
jgi:hypothetical protein